MVVYWCLDGKTPNSRSIRPLVYEAQAAGSLATKEGDCEPAVHSEALAYSLLRSASYFHVDDRSLAVHSEQRDLACDPEVEDVLSRWELIDCVWQRCRWMQSMDTCQVQCYLPHLVFSVHSRSLQGSMVVELMVVLLVAGAHSHGVDLADWCLSGALAYQLPEGSNDFGTVTKIGDLAGRVADGDDVDGSSDCRSDTSRSHSKRWFLCQTQTKASDRDGTVFLMMARAPKACCDEQAD